MAGGVAEEAGTGVGTVDAALREAEAAAELEALERQAAYALELGGGHVLPPAAAAQPAGWWRTPDGAAMPTFVEGAALP
eukprot:12275072-Alexandrium_andersonii.AAC.1